MPHASQWGQHLEADVLYRALVARGIAVPAGESNRRSRPRTSSRSGQSAAARSRAARRSWLRAGGVAARARAMPRSAIGVGRVGREPDRFAEIRDRSGRIARRAQQSPVHVGRAPTARAGSSGPCPRARARSRRAAGGRRCGCCTLSAASGTPSDERAVVLGDRALRSRPARATCCPSRSGPARCPDGRRATRCQRVSRVAPDETLARAASPRARAAQSAQAAARARCRAGGSRAVRGAARPAAKSAANGTPAR